MKIWMVVKPYFKVKQYFDKLLANISIQPLPSYR